MLVRAAKSNFVSLHEVTKQLLIWTFSKKQEIHCSCRSYHSRPDKRFRRWENNFAISRKSYKLQDLRPFEKNFYVPHPNVANRSESEIKEFHQKHDIKLFGNLEKSPAPIFTFEELSLDNETREVIRNLNYSEPTPIQSLTWPIALSGLNMVGIARTGSGKTLGFALPGLIHVKHQPAIEKITGPVALVIAPTRELAQQTDQVFQRFSRSCSFHTACVFGGVSKQAQLDKLGRAQICIGTPGRIIDFLRDGYVDLRDCTYLVLDEADRLLDMGFEPQIRSIMDQMRPDRQVLMWSATWPTDVQHLAADFLDNFIGVKFGSAQLSANPNITQEVHVCDFRDKRKLLLKTLSEIFANEDSKTLIFTQTKDMVQQLHHFLIKKGYETELLHGDMSQEKRNRALSRFKSGKVQILVGTLVVSRGLDISDIKHVVIYDFPNTVEDYVHIIGRTGRCEREGHSHAFFTPQDGKLANELIKVLNGTNQEINPDLLNLGNDRRSRRYGNVFGK